MLPPRAERGDTGGHPDIGNRATQRGLSDPVRAGSHGDDAGEYSTEGGTKKVLPGVGCPQEVMHRASEAVRRISQQNRDPLA